MVFGNEREPTLKHDYRRSTYRVNFWKLLGYMTLLVAGSFILGFVLGGWL